MNYNPVGNTGINVSAIGLGCSKIGSIGTGVSRAESSRVVEDAFDLGINFFDTANIYGQGDSEKIIGRAFAGRRDKVVILTKAGYHLKHLGPLTKLVKPFARAVVQRLKASRRVVSRVRSGAAAQRFDPEYVRRCLEGSLKRLGTDYVDFFLLHSPPVDVLARDDLFDELESLKTAGKLRHYGFSMISFAPDLASNLPGGVELIGSAINPLETSNLDQLPELAQREGLSVLGYQPFGSGGLLKASEEDGGEGAAHRERVRRALLQAGQDAGLSVPQTIVQLVLQQPAVSTVVVGSSSRRHLEENIAAVDSTSKVPTSAMRID